MSTSTTCYLKRGTSFLPTNDESLNIHKLLPAGKYIIVKDPQTDALFFMEIDSDYDFSHRIYGKTTRHANRIMATFRDRPATTGVALVGEKGSGKTMLARLLSKLCADEGIPTIVINQPYVGEDFNKLIQDIKQPCMILFDEFEKVYDSEDQQRVLTLLDGVFPSKKLFVLTSNDQYQIDQHMRNRPGRIYYMIEYEGVDEEQIVQYCDHNLDNKTHAPEIVKLSKLFSRFNFDMLKALVEEMNRYNEDPHQAMEMLNARPSNDNDGVYHASLTVRGQAVDSVWPHKIDRNPLSFVRQEFAYTQKNSTASDADEDVDEWNEESKTKQVFDQADLQSIDLKLGVFVYRNQTGGEVTFTRQHSRTGDFRTILSNLPIA